jgi:hypothetical protein
MLPSHPFTARVSVRPVGADERSAARLVYKAERARRREDKRARKQSERNAHLRSIMSFQDFLRVKRIRNGG